MRFPFICLLACQFMKGDAERTKEKMYVDVSDGGRAACFKRLNATHQIGCTSEPNGNVGVVHFINTPEDLDWLIDKGPHKPYAVLLNALNFNHNNVSRLRASGKINGIMVIHIEDNENTTLSPVPEAFSADMSCPNDRYGLYSDSAEFRDCSKVKWNPAGEGMMFEDYGFPIFLLTKEADVIFAIEKCYERFNKPDDNGSPREYPLCAVELKDRMDGAKDSETCIRRTRHQMNLNPDRYCDPMGDQNVFTMFKEIHDDTERPADSVIIAAARMDSFSMFENYYPSADNHVTGIVALLAVVVAFGNVKDHIKRPASKDIMFTFFQGEAFDYIGSDRMVYDMEHNNFPLALSGRLQAINLSNIASFVEVNQLAYRDREKVWVHTDPLTRPNVSTKVAEMVSDLKLIGDGLVDEADPALPLPPASAQTFLKKRKDIPVVVITEHEKEYMNKYYNSRFDLAKEIQLSYPENLNDTEKYDYVTDQAVNLTKVATVLAKFLYKQATGEKASEDFEVKNSTVAHLLYCYLISPNCELLKEVLNNETASKLADKPYPYYVGVDTQTNEYTYMTKNLLLYFLGDTDNSTIKLKDCSNKNNQAFYRYSLMQGPRDENGTRHPFCMRGLANYSKAVSMAFELDDYDYSSGQFSTWTESSWAVDAMNVRFFLIPSKKFEIVTLVVGLLILILSICGGLFLNKKASILFHTSESQEAPAPVSL